MIEIVSPANKDRAQHVKSFATKAVEALDAGVHLLIVDLFPPGKFDAHGVHGEICEQLGLSDEPDDLPANEPLTLAAYAASAPVEVYLEHVAPGAALIDMPLFLRRERYVATPLETTYRAAYEGVPAVWRDVLEVRARAAR